MRILLVEDDLELADGLASALAQSGYAVDAVHNGRCALAACEAASYDLVVLDLGLPDVDGMDVLRRLRRDRFTAPILILTARDEPKHRVLGLDSGGDDYLSKPFDIAELEARIRALLRRGDPASTTLRLGAITFEPLSRRFTVRGIELDLTARELAVLELLLRRAGRIVSKKHIFDSLYGFDDDVSVSNVEVFVSRIRRKLVAAGADVGVRVFRGLGYRLERDGVRGENI